MRINKVSMRAVLGMLIVLLLFPVLTFACSGEGASALIEHNRIITRWFAALSISLLLAMVILYFKRRKKGLPVIVLSLILLALHPAWFYGGGGGDCGMSMVENAQWIMGLLAVGVAYQLTMWLVKRRGVIEGGA
jgi:hypothetical protein